jgi:pyruvate dehydrogenase E2 component (dihydrolipoamide acetyltransferase)
MPPLGTTSDELRIVEWLKAEGEEVALGEPLLAVETDKATLEVEAATAGTLLRVVCKAGAVVEVGTVLAYVGAAGEEIPVEPERGVGGAEPARVAASPAVRRLASERGVDLAQVVGSGPGGRVEKRDVLALAGGAEAGAHAVTVGEPDAGEPDAGEPVPPHRRALARRLERSAAIPQFSVGVTVDMTSARAVLERERAGAAPGLSYTHLLLRAISAALRAHPAMNVVWLEPGPERQPARQRESGSQREPEPGAGPRRVRFDRSDVGLAVAGDDALLVVTIPEPDRPPLAELVEEADRAASEARSGRISERHAAPAAVTLSNLGMVGVDRFTAVVDPEQTAILAAGAVVERPAAVAGGVGLVPQLELVLTADHRAVDGMVAGRFLVEVRARLAGSEPSPSAP